MTMSKYAHGCCLIAVRSQRSYISEKVRNRLNLKALRSEKVIIKTFGQGEESKVQKLDIVQFKIKNKFNSNFIVVEALCVPSICSPLTNQCTESVRKCQEFSEFQFADYEDHSSAGRPVGILVGIDYYHAFMTGRVVRSQLGPVSSETKVGWVVSGRSVSSAGSMHCLETHLLRTTVEKEDYNLRQELEKFWSVENIGFSRDCVVSQFQKDIVHNGIRYEAKLPFKPDHELLQDNFGVCEGRLKSLKNRLVAKGILNAYDKVFSDYEQQGIIERVPLDDIAKELGKVHYLPHRPVLRADKDTTKIRAVFRPIYTMRQVVCDCHSDV